MELVRNLHHYFSMHAQTVAASVKAGVDAMSDPVPVVEEATRQAVCLAQKADTVIIALGCHPMVCAKEETDRTTLALPPRQQSKSKCSLRFVFQLSVYNPHDPESFASDFVECNWKSGYGNGNGKDTVWSKCAGRKTKYDLVQFG